MSDLMDNKPRKYFIVKDKDGNAKQGTVSITRLDNKPRNNVQVFTKIKWIFCLAGSQSGAGATSKRRSMF